MKKWIASRAFLGLALAGAVASSFYGVSGPKPIELRPVAGDDPMPPAPSVRNVRALIVSGVARLRVRGDSALSIRDDRLEDLGSYDAPDWMVVAPTSTGDLRFGTHLWPTSDLWVEPAGGGTVSLSVDRDREWSIETTYPGTLRILVGEDGSLEVINHVDIERYVACVVANEVWPTFDIEAYRAQAVVARTYVLYQMTRRQEAVFDVSANQGSQVYRGVRTDGPGRRAAGAAVDTRGIVLTWQDRGRNRLFCAYYSAVCGGLSQSAAIFGSEGDIEPLSGGIECDYCKIAPGHTYRWGPIRLGKREIRANLVARYRELKSLGRIQRIEVGDRTTSARPVTIRITDSNGHSLEMLAERFRLGVGGNDLRSTDFRVRDAGRDVIFDRGRGFGHGLGLCQWGMQGQALQGRRAGEILRYYYPGAALTRVY